MFFFQSFDESESAINFENVNFRPKNVIAEGYNATTSGQATPGLAAEALNDGQLIAVKTPQGEQPCSSSSPAVTSGSATRQASPRNAVTSGSATRQASPRNAVRNAVTSGSATRQPSPRNAVKSGSATRQPSPTNAVTSGSATRQPSPTNAVTSGSATRQTSPRNAVTSGSATRQPSPTNAVTSGSATRQPSPTNAVTSGSATRQPSPRNAVTSCPPGDQQTPTSSSVSSAPRNQPAQPQVLMQNMHKDSPLPLPAVLGSAVSPCKEPLLPSQAAYDVSQERRLPTAPREENPNIVDVNSAVGLPPTYEESMAMGSPLLNRDVEQFPIPYHMIEPGGQGCVILLLFSSGSCEDAQTSFRRSVANMMLHNGQILGFTRQVRNPEVYNYCLYSWPLRELSD